MNRSQSSISAFTLIETVFATMLFGILIAATFSVLRYIGQTTQESRDAIRIAQSIENAMTVLNVASRSDASGWSGFITGALGKTYRITSSYGLQDLGASPPAMTEGEWRATVSVDPDLGPYLQQIAYNSTAQTYTLTFSGDVYGKSKDLNRLVPVISSTAARWTDEASPFATTPATAANVVVITTTAGQAAALGGQRIKPGTDLVDREERSDITHESGVALPTGATPSTGVPAMVRVRLQTLSGGTTLFYNATLAAQP